MCIYPKFYWVFFWEGFDFLFWFSRFFIGCIFYSVLGAVYLIYHLIFQKSINWSDFNLQNDGGELLQVGLGLFLLQVG